MKNKEINNLIRDITKAGFMPKSEARRRIKEILLSQEKEDKEYKDFYERAKKERCKIAQVNYDLGKKEERTKLIEEFKKIVGEDEKVFKHDQEFHSDCPVDEHCDKCEELYGIERYNQAKQEIREGIKKL